MDSNDVQIPKNPKCVTCHKFVKKVSGKMKVVQNKNEAIAFPSLYCDVVKFTHHIKKIELG